MRRVYCTYFDRGYFSRGITLWQSLIRNGTDIRLYVLCLDDETYSRIEAIGQPSLVPVRLAELEQFDPQLAAVKGTRSKIEYYFTCSPVFPLYLLKSHGDIELVTYLDADLYFYSDPEDAVRELGGNSVMIVEHRFAPALSDRLIAGRFNVSFMSFRNDTVGLACLEWWRERCIEWCYARFEDGKYADQKYLDEWPARFHDVAILQGKGAGLAPWNVGQYEFSMRDGKVLVDGSPLVFYHFHALRVLSRRAFDTRLRAYSAKLDPIVRDEIYRPYLRELTAVDRRYRDPLPGDWRERLGYGLRSLTRGDLVVIPG